MCFQFTDKVLNTYIVFSVHKKEQQTNNKHLLYTFKCRINASALMYLVFNKGDVPMGAPPCPDKPMFTSQTTLLQDTLTTTVTFLILQFYYQLSSFSPH